MAASDSTLLRGGRHIAYVGYHSGVRSLTANLTNWVLRYHSVGGGTYDDFDPDQLRRDVEYLDARYEIVDLPVVSTDGGDVRQRLEGVDPSAVCRTDADLVAGLVDALDRGSASDGRKRIEMLGMDRMGERIVSVYQSVLGDAGAAPPRYEQPAESSRTHDGRAH